MDINNPLEKAKWLKLRSKNVSSTETAALFGLSPYLTEFELYHRKKDGGLGEISESFRMKMGNLMEPIIAQLAGDELNTQVEPYKDYIIIPEIRMGSSFDYITVDGSALIECKNVDSMVYYREWSEDEAPPHIETQVQHQMEVADIDLCYIAALVGGNDLKIIKRQRDREVGQALRQAVVNFWKSVEDGNEPDPNFERDAAFVASLYNTADADKVVEGDAEVAALIEEYAAFGRTEKQLKIAKDEIKARVYATIEDAGKLLVPGYSVACTVTKDTPAKVLHITPDMVNTDYELSKGRKGYRQFRVTKLKEKKQ